MNHLKNLLLSLGLIALLPTLAVAQPLTKAEQGCLNTVNKSLSLIAKSQQKENAVETAARTTVPARPNAEVEV